MAKAVDINIRHYNKRVVHNLRKKHARLHGKKTVALVQNPGLSKKCLDKRAHRAKMVAREAERLENLSKGKKADSSINKTKMND